MPTEEKREHKKVYILGAGITGLITAWKLINAGREVTIIERDTEYGGLAKTIDWDGFHFDNGAHNFWTYDQEILRFYQELMPDIFLQREHKFKLYLFEKLVRFPFLGTDIFITLGFKKSLWITITFTLTRIKAFIFKPRETPHLDEWIISRFGKALYRIYFQSYLTRIQKCDPHLLSSSIGVKKIPQMSLRKMIAGVWKHLILGIPAHTPSRVSYYPIGGYGELPGYFYREILKSPNFEYHANESILDFTVDKKKVVKMRTDKNEYNTEEADIISTIPLSNLCKFTNPDLVHLTDIGKHFEHVSMRFFLVKVNKPMVTGCWIVNFNDQRIPFYRIGEEVYNEFKCVPEGYSTLTFEIPVNHDEQLSVLSDEELLPIILDRFNIVFPLVKEDILEYKSIYCEHANPRLVVDYQKLVTESFNFILSTDNLFSIGRQGFFTYANLDQCTRMALDFSEYYLSGDPHEGNRTLLNRYFISGF
jgi:protoporphyrinogen oxidase